MHTNHDFYSITLGQHRFYYRLWILRTEYLGLVPPVCMDQHEMIDGLIWMACQPQPAFVFDLQLRQTVSYR